MVEKRDELIDDLGDVGPGDPGGPAGKGEEARHDLDDPPEFLIDLLDLPGDLRIFVLLFDQFTQREKDAPDSVTASRTSASSLRDMGTVMNALKSRLQGRADMGEVSRRVKALLQ